MESVTDKPISYYLFDVMYWTGIREGELLALTMKDFDIEDKKLSIIKSVQKINGKELLTDPKNEKSNRIIDLPSFLYDEMEDYMSMHYELPEDARIFPVTKSFIHHELDRGCKKAGVKRIRAHDLRHSHVAYLINLGFNPVDIAVRLGQESAVITMNTYL